MSAAAAPESLVRDLRHRVLWVQKKQRLPSVSAAVSRNGELLWSEAVGVADEDAGAAATPDTQYRVGSITKTFTAVAIMQLRDAGELGLDERLGDHVPEAAHPGPTIRRMLSHHSGLQREPAGELWETMQPPTVNDLLGRLVEAEQVLEPGRHFHYSNLAFALLGEVVARRSGRPYVEHVQERILDPLGLSRTTWAPSGARAKGYFVEPYSDSLKPERDDLDLVAAASAGQLWSTTADLCCWGAFLADPVPEVLAPATVEEMHSVHVMLDDRWQEAWGLGLGLTRVGERILAGHSGGMPGHLSGFTYSRKDGISAAALTNAGADMQALAVRLAVAAIEALPTEPEPWRPAGPPPSEVAGILGRWWSEGEESVFSFRNGRLQARRTHDRPEEEPSVFEPDGPDRYRVVSGRERGELLRAVRDDAGEVVKLYWATYPFHREPFSFGSTI
jgi:CubicO group peptidase (beta-lactamase class C family)